MIIKLITVVAKVFSNTLIFLLQMQKLLTFFQQKIFILLQAVKSILK